MRALKIIGNATLWACLAAVVGTHFGYKSGYANGIKDTARFVMDLRESGGTIPAPFTKGGI